MLSLEVLLVTDPQLEKRLSIDSLFHPDDLKHLSINDQDSGFTWDDQYDARANYCLTFSADRSKGNRSQPSSESTDSNDGTSPALDHRKNEWSLDSSLTSNQPTDSNAPHSSISWKQMREEEQRNSAMKSKLPSDSSPLNLYKRFQPKSSTLQRDNHLSRLSNDERIMSQSVLSSQRHQAIQTSILFDSPPSISQQHRTTDTTDNHLLPPRASSANHKSLPDLSFISQYSKELPRSRTTSPLPSSTLPPPITVQPAKQEPERPRTLKSIKRYKNSKHSTEPLGVFYSPQLRKTFAAVPSSAVIQRSDITPAMIEMRLPVASPQLNSSRKLGTRANSCDIQAILQEYKSPISTCHPTIALNDEMISEKDLSVLVHCHDEKRKERKGAYRYGGMRRCQTDIIVVDPVLHRQSFTESPPNEFRLQEHDPSNMSTLHDDDNDLLGQSHVNIIPDAEQSLPANKPASPEHRIPSPVVTTSAPTNESRTLFDDFVERVHQVILRLFEIKRSDKAFFLNNEHHGQLDTLLKNDLCPAIQQILEHGLKLQGKDSQTLKRTNIWKIIEISINHGQVPAVYLEAKQLAQYASSHWIYKFQAFVFALLNKSELVNWLYYFTRQKDLLQRYYQSPDAFILVSSATTFSQFERIMTQLEKLTPLAFRLTYLPPSTSSTVVNDPLQTSVLSTNSNRVSARDWIMTISRRNSKTFTQPIDPAVTNETLRSTLSRRLNALFTKGTGSQLPKPSLVGNLKSPATSRRPRLSNVFNPTARGVSENRLDFIERNVSPSSARTVPFQSKIPRRSLNVDKPKSARYRSAAPAPR